MYDKSVIQRIKRVLKKSLWNGEVMVLPLALKCTGL